jgi:L-asparaginase II
LGPIRVTAKRGKVVEGIHRVHVASSEGLLHGDDVTLLLRSSVKPLQAIPFAEAYDDLDDDELAIACASHQAEPAQLDAVRKVLARAHATVEDLENGPQAGRPDGKLGHNCSGKHAGMLAACAANGWPFAGYRFPVHPLQVRIGGLVGAPEGGVDGCGLPTYATSLSEAARLLLRTPPRIVAAMRARPDLVGGRGIDDTVLMETRPGWLAKRGAEGLLCAVSPDGVGYAFKVEDGNGRALRPAIAAVLGIDELASVELDNSLGEPVGVLRVE